MSYIWNLIRAKCGLLRSIHDEFDDILNDHNIAAHIRIVFTEIIKISDQTVLEVNNFEFQVQIRPWCLSDADFVMDASQILDPRKTIFVGGVPRPLRAVELALIMDRLYGGVCYAGIDVDPELKYPKGKLNV